MDQLNVSIPDYRKKQLQRILSFEFGETTLEERLPALVEDLLRDYADFGEFETEEELTLALKWVEDKKPVTIKNYLGKSWEVYCQPGLEGFPRELCLKVFPTEEEAFEWVGAHKLPTK